MIDIRLENISKTYDNGYNAVKSISFTAQKGEFVILVGPSGCGKTSVLKMLAGLESISSGNLYFGDKVVNTLAPKDRNIGMVFQNYALYPHLTVFENIAFPLTIKKINKKIIKEQVDSTAKLLGLEGFLNQKPKELSGGQRQRVALGRALIKQPNVYLFDEPLSNLDAKLRVNMRTEIVNLHRIGGATSVYVTHDQTEAMTMGDKLIVMNKGELQQADTPENIYNEPANLFVATFIGSPQINVFKGEVFNEDGLKFKEYNSDIIINIPNKYIDSVKIKQMINLCIRPEYMNISDSPFDAQVSAIVFGVEYLGYEKLIYFKTNDELKSCRIKDLEKNICINQNIGFSMNPDKILLFDSDGRKI